MKPSTEAYHRGELSIARTAGDPRRILPNLPASKRAVPDVGCGAGQTLQALHLPAESLLCGVDSNEDAIKLGRRLDRRLLLVTAVGEALPFADCVFDAVICRVALPYMDITLALREMARVLHPNGHLWLTLHSVRMALGSLWKHFRRSEPKGAFFQIYAIVNGLTFDMWGRQFRLPSVSNIESVQTKRGILKALKSAGFRDIAVSQERFFVVTAAKVARAAHP